MRDSLVLLTVCTGLFSAAALVQEGATNEFALESVGGDVGLIVNPNGGNVAVLKNEAGTAIVDSNLENFRSGYAKAFDQYAGQAPRFLINTHWHGDHTGNNLLLGRKGVPIVAHERVRLRMEASPKIEGRKGAGIAAEAYPTVTYDDGLELFVGPERIELKYYGSGHTDGDGVVWFHHSKVVHMGDLFFHGMFPFIDLGSGGDPQGYAAAVGAVIAELEAIDGENWRIIPGHGAVCGLADLTSFHKMLTGSIRAVSEAQASGMSMEEMLAKKILGLYESFSWRFISTQRFLETLATHLATK